MVQIIIYASLVLILILFVVQSVRLGRRTSQLGQLLKRVQELDGQAGLGRMLAGVAHDLNTPLGALGCALNTRRQALEKLRCILSSPGGSDADPAGVQRVLKAFNETDDVVEDAMNRSLQMIGSLRVAGRGEPEEPVSIPVSEIMAHVLRLLNHRMKKGITVVNALDPEVKAVVHPGKLGRVFANLLSNSIDAMDGRGTIRITSSVLEGRICLTLEDDGPGFPVGKCEAAFCSGWTTKGCEKGSGLGLYVSRGIVEDYGGTITAANSPAGGAEVTVCLPADSGVAG